MTGPVVELTDAPAPEDLAAIGAGLAEFNARDVGPAGKLPLAIVLRGPKGAVQGGLSGYTAWGWLYIQWLWLSEDLRGRGEARRMLEIAETEALRRGCHGSYIDTFNPVALKVYQAAGYVVFGAMDDFPIGRRRSFLQKRLAAR